MTPFTDENEHVNTVEPHARSVVSAVVAASQTPLVVGDSQVGTHRGDDSDSDP